MVGIVVHGGAWDIPDALIESHRIGLQRALIVGMAVLNDGGSAVDAVEAAIVVMEDDETFDAGIGSFLNSAGEVELDASIMDGKLFRAGAVAAVQNVRNPIRLARVIMEESENVLLVGKGAVRFAKDHGLKTCSQDELITEREIERWRDLQKKSAGQTRGAFRKMKIPNDTVGAIALDKNGNIAAATSTGGTPNKCPGRVGDSPIIGAGIYADNSVGAVATTGWGEAMMKVVMAKSVVDIMERNGDNPVSAATEGLKLLERKAQGYGGIIALNIDGEIGISYNTPRMARGYMTSDRQEPWVAV